MFETAVRRVRLVCVVGARPNFMKIAPLMRAFSSRTPHLDVRLVHTGQHYDVAMNEQFFRQLSIPAPDVSLEVGSGTHAVQTAEIMKRFEPVVDREAPDAVLVVGDVNSTIACSLVAAKKGIRVVHVEAGLRSRDRSMPEEINRILTDQLSDRLYVTEEDAIRNLEAEGIARQKVCHAGNVMIDNLFACLPSAVPASQTLEQAFAGRDPQSLSRGFAVLTLHRPSNVDDRGTLARLLSTVGAISLRLPIVFPMHPRTRARIEEFGLAHRIEGQGIGVTGPLGFLEMLGLLNSASCVLTDSGGLQEEATALGLPCLTLRENTERPITVSHGTNEVVGTDPDRIMAAFDRALRRDRGQAPRPLLWDGRAAERIADDLSAWLLRECVLA